jgi:hypothetical protein
MSSVVNSHSHQINQSSMTGNNSSSDTHNGAAVLSNDGQTFVPGGAGMAQALSGKIFGSLNPNIDSTLGQNSLDSITRLQIDDNMLANLEGFGPVQGLNAASQMGSFNGMSAVELKNASDALGADIKGNTGPVSPQKGGQSH